MVIVSDRTLATQASVSVRARTLTGSRPTGMDLSRVSDPFAPTLNTSSIASGVLTTRSFPLEGVRAIGWTCEDSKFVYDAAAGGAGRIVSTRAPAAPRPSQFIGLSPKEG